MMARLLDHREIETNAGYAHLARDSVHEVAARVADSTADDILKRWTRETRQRIAQQALPTGA